MTPSNNSVELSRNLKRSIDHIHRRNLFLLLLFLQKVNTLLGIIDLPCDSILIVVLLDEESEFVGVIDHEQLTHILHTERFIRLLAGSCHFVSDSVGELVDEELVGLQWHVLFGIEDHVVAAFHEVGLHLHRNLNVYVAELAVRDQLHLCMELSNFIERQQVQEV